MAAFLKSLPRAMKAALTMVYPPQCLSCGIAVEQDGALCPACWRDCEFVSGCACHVCGVPLPGVAAEAGLICDDCLRLRPSWHAGRAALVYGGVGRGMVLALKHGDRPDLAVPLGQWLADAARPLVTDDTVILPIPLHPRRFMVRKYNQADLLAQQIGRRTGLAVMPSLLRRTRATQAQDHRSHAERHENLKDAFSVSPRGCKLLASRPVLLVDDVMASGATMEAASRALLAQGVEQVSVAVLARAVKQ
ncbi:ComF family protein [Paracoccus aerodenitrificans]|uniref:ComF family protein n=1 Tax=Paracoccus aerodenitrificans TaxID=3017781 RepID=UPI0022F0F8F4|nr:ComF family protein [Paracoccus aerodenitrificans]WBU63256.1 ComF family protein [Paracoccus aerodenitrificans]